MRNIFRKLDVSSRVDVARAVEQSDRAQQDLDAATLTGATWLVSRFGERQPLAKTLSSLEGAWGRRPYR